MYTHCEDVKYHHTSNGWTLATVSAWKNSVYVTIGVGMLIGQRALKSLNSIEKIQPMMVATFNGNPSATIISCYSLTKVSEETDLIAFYNELSSLVCSISKQRSHYQWRHECPKNINHKFTLHNSSNRNGEHLTDFKNNVLSANKELLTGITDKKK